MFTLYLKDLKFYSYHGFYTEEQQVGNEFILSAKVSYKINENKNKYELINIINYEEVYEIIKNRMSNTYKILENLLKDIANDIKNKFPKTSKIYLVIHKTYPVLENFDGRLGIEYQESFS